MAGKKIRLLLNKTVENLGIVGDIVKVRPGFARNYLLPQALAEAPTPTKIERLKEARAAAQSELANLRSAREELLGRMKDVAVTIQRSCNDQGILYGSVTQRDISEALQAAGYDVGIRSVRLNQSIRRVGAYHVPIQFEKDLRTDITLNVEADRQFQDEREEMEIDDEGELVEKGAPRDGRGNRGGGRENRGRGRSQDRDRGDRGERGGRDRDRKREATPAQAPAAPVAAAVAEEKPKAEKARRTSAKP